MENQQNTPKTADHAAENTKTIEDENLIKIKKEEMMKNSEIEIEQDVVILETDITKIKIEESKTITKPDNKIIKSEQNLLLEEEKLIDRKVEDNDDDKTTKDDGAAYQANLNDDKNEKNETWSWKGLSSWGTSMINDAASSVTTFTAQVGDGLFQVLETVESGLLVQDDSEDSFEKTKSESKEKDPITDQHSIDPKAETENIDNDEIKEIKEEKKVGGDDDDNGKTSSSSSSSWWYSQLSNVVSKTTSAVQKTTNVVVHGGLDVLETIGKKTFDVLTEGDHGLKQVIKKNKENKQMPNLSLVLKEAKEIAEMRMKEEESLLESKKYLYGYWFDEFQGLLNLEAFELLCQEKEVEVRALYDDCDKDRLSVIKGKLAQLNQLFKDANDDDDEDAADDNDEEAVEHEFHQLLLDYAAKLPVVINVQKISEFQESTRKWLREEEIGIADDEAKDDEAKFVLKKAMQCLAQLTALSIQHYHKLAQLFLRSLEAGSESSPLSPPSSSSPSSSSPSPAASEAFANVSIIETASIIIGFSKVLRNELTIEANKFVNILGSFNSTSKQDSAATEASKVAAEVATTASNIDDYITSVYLEAANSGNFVRKCLKMLMPILKIAIIKVG